MRNEGFVAEGGEGTVDGDRAIEDRYRDSSRRLVSREESKVKTV